MATPFPPQHTHGEHLAALTGPPSQHAGDGFVRLFGNLRPAAFRTESLTQLAQSMFTDGPATAAEVAAGESEIPAGYTYLGQFVDHDVRFDPIASLRRKDPSLARRDLRPPRLDLESLYGRGPDDQPYLYEPDGIHMVLGEVLGPQTGPADERTPRDVPRTPEGRAIIEDPRNDGTVILAQLHALFLQFHNRVASELRGPFLKVQDAVRWHYQWIVLHDVLKKAVDEETFHNVLPDPRRPDEVHFQLYQFDRPAIPVEFAAAAYRFPHAMVRPSYRLNQNSQDDTGVTGPFPILGALPDGKPDLLGSLVGMRRFRRDWVIDWRFFFDGAPRPPYSDPEEKPPVAQKAMQINTSLSEPLRNLPKGFIPPDGYNSLAERDLLRGVQLGLPSGQAIADALNIPRLEPDVLFASRPELAHDFQEHTPLWYYLLAEAEHVGEGRLLGPIGARIVMETVVALLCHDKQSLLYQPDFQPMFQRDGKFEMGELITVAQTAARGSAGM